MPPESLLFSVQLTSIICPALHLARSRHATVCGFNDSSSLLDFQVLESENFDVLYVNSHSSQYTVDPLSMPDE